MNPYVGDDASSLVTNSFCPLTPPSPSSSLFGARCATTVHARVVLRPEKRAWRGTNAGSVGETYVDVVLNESVWWLVGVS
jgi:hypothetical protein